MASLACALVTAATSARAQREGATPEALVQQGADLARDGNLQRALEVLREALGRERSGRALAELAYVEQSLNLVLEAEEHLAEALTLSDERWVRHHARDVERALASTRASIGAVRVTSNVEGAEVRLNGALAGRTPLREAVRVPLGRVVVEARAAGYRTTSREAMVRSGETAEAHVSLDRDAPPRPEAPPPLRCAPGLVLRDGLCFAPEPVDDGSISPYRWMLYAGGAVTVVSMGVAIGLGLNGNGIEGAYLARCGGAGVAASCAGDWRTTQDTLSSQAAAVNTFWVLSSLGAVTAAVGLGLELQRARRRPSMTRAALTVVPAGVRLTW